MRQYKCLIRARYGESWRHGVMLSVKNVVPLSIPKRLSAVRSEPHSDWEFELEVGLEGWLWMIIRRQYRAGEPYRFFDKVRLTVEVINRWFKQFSDFNDAVDSTPELFEELSQEQK